MSVEEYLKQDRQWPRHLRIKHAQYQLLRTSPKSAEEKFWNAVLAANMDR